MPGVSRPPLEEPARRDALARACRSSRDCGQNPVDGESFLGLRPSYKFLPSSPFTSTVDAPGRIGTVSMTRKAKAVWIGFLAPVIMLWVWALVASAVIGGCDERDHAASLPYRAPPPGGLGSALRQVWPSLSAKRQPANSRERKRLSKVAARAVRQRTAQWWPRPQARDLRERGYEHATADRRYGVP